MLESIIKGYKNNEFRDKNFKQPSRSSDEIVGGLIYLYFKQLMDIKNYIKKYLNYLIKND